MEITRDIGMLILALVGVWLGSGLAINSVEKLSSRINASSFALSFFILGFVTSITEISVALNSYLNNEVEISVGNLMGGMFVMFMFVIPLLAIGGKGITLQHEFSPSKLFLCLVVLLTPFLLLIDRNLGQAEGAILVLLYTTVLYLIYRKKPETNKILSVFNRPEKLNVVPLVAAIVVGAVILIISGNFLVKEVIDLATELKVSPFAISLLGLSVGTNFPELSVAFRSIVKKKTDIAFGNYVGSAVFNIFILGALAIVSNGFRIQADFYKLLLFSFSGLLLFYIFIRTKNRLSRRESLVLLCIYFAFVVSEIVMVSR